MWGGKAWRIETNSQKVYAARITLPGKTNGFLITERDHDPTVVFPHRIVLTSRRGKNWFGSGKPKIAYC